MSMITIVRPDAEEDVNVVRPKARRRALQNGGRIVLIDNRKPKARELLEMIADELRARSPITNVEVVAKDNATIPITADVAKGIAGRADLVIAGLGDCGACSACSLHDAVQMEHLGIPSTVLITDAFVGHVAKFSTNLGLPNYHSLVVPHPIATKDEAHLRKLAAHVADAACLQLFEQAPARVA